MSSLYKSATELVAALAHKEISSCELVEETIARIELIDKKINAMPVRDFEQARVAAKAADAAIARGEQKPLLGLPISIKESFHVAGLPTTLGDSQYKDWRPDEDALAVARLKSAGAIIIGKTNVPFMLKDWQSYNDVYGITNNPWDLNLTPGGSSGGAAAALAAGLVSLELGSDAAGSLRVPAHFCGVYTHKPTQDLIPLRGSSPPYIPSSPNRVDFVVAGPMARTAYDLTLALDILAGPDEHLDGKGYQLRLPAPRHQQLSDYRVLVIDTHPLSPMSTIVAKKIDDFINSLIKARVSISRDDKLIPELEKIMNTYTFLLAAHGSADMPMDMYTKLQAVTNKLEKDDAAISAYLFRGTVCSHREWLLATRQRVALRQQWRQLFSDYDVIICPVTATAAFPHDHSNQQTRTIQVDNLMVPYTTQFAWASIATLFGLPATVIPINFTGDGLPVGVQIIGDYLEDYTTIKFAELIERELGGFSKPII